MSDNHGRARVREAAVDWINRTCGEPTSPDLPDPFTREMMVDAFEAGAALSDDLLDDAAALFRRYEKHHRSEAFRLHSGSSDHQARMAKSDTNRMMADRIEQRIGRAKPVEAARTAAPVANLRPITSGPLADEEMVEALIDTAHQNNDEGKDPKQWN
jgi:hypothetical protein